VKLRGSSLLVGPGVGWLDAIRNAQQVPGSRLPSIASL
jgi:hypothetical protein